MALSKDEMDFVIQLLDRRPEISEKNIINDWLNSYYIRDVRTTIIIPPPDKI